MPLAWSESSLAQRDCGPVDQHAQQPISSGKVVCRGTKSQSGAPRRLCEEPRIGAVGHGGMETDRFPAQVSLPEF